MTTGKEERHGVTSRCRRRLAPEPAGHGGRVSRCRSRARSTPQPDADARMNNVTATLASHHRRFSCSGQTPLASWILHYASSPPCSSAWVSPASQRRRRTFSGGVATRNRSCPPELHGTAVREGFATVVFTFDDDGRITDRLVIATTHPAFNQSVLTAMRRWIVDSAGSTHRSHRPGHCLAHRDVPFGIFGQIVARPREGFRSFAHAGGWVAPDLLTLTRQSLP